MEKERTIVKVDKDLEDLIPGYLARRQDDITAIRDSCARNDFEKVRVLGHSMKGSGGGYGFERITEIGKLIEESAKNQDPATISTCIDELADYLSRIDITYE